MIRKYNIEKATTEPMVTVIANDNWIEFTIRHAVNYKRKRITKDHLFTSIPSEINQPAGKVQCASTTFEVVASSPITSNLTSPWALPIFHFSKRDALQSHPNS